MRRKDREVTRINELIKIIEACKVCRIAMQDEAGLYIVPLNFGYTLDNHQLVLYFHSAKEGRKIDALKANPAVGFEMDCEHRLLAAPEACEYGYAFKSIIGNGRAIFIDGVDEKKSALTALMKHQTGQDFPFEDSMTDSVSLFKIIVDRFVGKDHP